MDRAIITLRKLALLGGDLTVFFLALRLAVATRGLEVGARITFSEHLLPFSAVFILWLLILVTAGLYDLTSYRDRLTLLRQLIAALTVAAAMAVAFFYLTPGIAIAPKTTLFLDLLLTALMLVAWRLITLRLFRGGRFRSRVLFVGQNDETAAVIGLLRSQPLLGLDVVGVIVLDGSNAPGVPVRRTLEGFADYLRAERVDTVVLALSPRTSPELTRRLYESIFQKVNFVDIVNYYEQTTQRVPISAITRIWFLENLQESTKRLYEKAKRATDFFLAAAAGAATLLLLPLIALAVWTDNGRPIFYSQERLGRDGKRFWIKKFRTMVVGAEADGARFAEKNDRRITRVGRLLRATRLDELPQFWNVLRGDMAIVGPRPERPEFAATLTADMPYYPMRLLVRPGLTGWAQINHPYYATPEEHRLKLQYDLYYVKNRSLALDGMILLKTLNTILRARGQ